MNFRPYLMDSIADKVWSKGKINVSGPRPYACSYMAIYLKADCLLLTSKKSVFNNFRNYFQSKESCIECI